MSTRINPFAANTRALGFTTVAGGLIKTAPYTHHDITAQARADKLAFAAIRKAQSRMDSRSIRAAMMIELHSLEIAAS